MLFYSPSKKNHIFAFSFYLENNIVITKLRFSIYKKPNRFSFRGITSEMIAKVEIFSKKGNFIESLSNISENLSL